MHPLRGDVCTNLQWIEENGFERTLYTFSLDSWHFTFIKSRTVWLFFRALPLSFLPVTPTQISLLHVRANPTIKRHVFRALEIALNHTQTTDSLHVEYWIKDDSVAPESHPPTTSYFSNEIWCGENGIFLLLLFTLFGKTNLPKEWMSIYLNIWCFRCS